MDPEATDAFDDFQAMFNIRGKHYRRSKSADKSADEGISPWKIGMMAACLLIWDVMWDVRLSHHYTCLWLLSLMCCQHMHTHNLCNVQVYTREHSPRSCSQYI